MADWWQRQALRLDAKWTITYLICLGSVALGLWVDWQPFRILAGASLVVLIGLAVIYWGAIIEMKLNDRKERRD